MHGWAIGRRISQISNDVLQVGQSALYPALHKLEQQGWIEAEWKTSENNRRAKYYAITRAGRQALAKRVTAVRTPLDRNLADRPSESEQRLRRHSAERPHADLSSITFDFSRRPGRTGPQRGAAVFAWRLARSGRRSIDL
jgi:DNA-binding PadR family transcriptional regulator